MGLLGLFGQPDVDKLSQKGNTPGLIKALGYDKDPAIRRKAAEALGKLKCSRAQDDLTTRLKDEDPGVRAAAAEALGLIGNPAAVTPLAQLSEDPELSVRQKAVASIGNIDDPKAAETLLTLLKKSPKPIIEDILHILGEKKIKKATPVLIEYTTNKKESIRKSAVAALAAIQDPETSSSLIAALSDPAPTIRSLAADGLGNLKTNNALEPLIKTLSDKDPQVRESAAHALGNIGDKRAAPHLETALKNRELFLPFITVHALEKRGFPDASKLLEKTLDKLTDSPNSSLSDAFKKIDPQWMLSPRIEETLITALANKNENISRTAANALRHIDWKPSLDLHHILLAVSEGKYEEAAQYGEKALIPILTHLKSDPNPDKILKSLEIIKNNKVLVNSQDSTTAETLTDFLHSDHHRPITQELLAQMGEIAIEPLKQIAADSDGTPLSHRKTAVDTLGKITHQNVIKPLLALTEDEDLTNHATNALRQVINSIPSEIEPDDLRALTTLDFPDIRETARQELIQRGERE